MNNPIIYFLLFLCGVNLNAQKTWEEVMGKLSKQSFSYLSFYIDQDWESYVDLTHDNILKMAGGQTVIVQVAQENRKMYAPCAPSTTCSSRSDLLVPAIQLLKSASVDSFHIRSHYSQEALSVDASASSPARRAD